MVPRIGFEPMTLGLEVLCSIQLSYQGTGTTLAAELDRPESAHFFNRLCLGQLSYQGNVWCGCGESNSDLKFGKLTY